MSQESDVAVPTELRPAEPDTIPQFRRNLFPKNLVLSARDLREFCELLEEANGRAKEIEFQRRTVVEDDDPQEARARINGLMPLEYNYTAINDDQVQGLGLPRTDERTFPDDLKSFFASNATFAERAVNLRPMNTVEVFLSFQRPSLKIDLQTLPSNPTENASVINIAGRDEDWVISTEERIKTFFKKREAMRPAIHGSGTYDYFTYLIFLPAFIWLLYKQGALVTVWLEKQSMFINVLLGIYALLLSLLVARFVFQYIRWLLPPMEYYKRSRVGAYIHRSVAAAVGAALLISATSDMLKVAFFWMIGG